MLYLFDQDDKFITILTEETGLVDMWFKDYQNHIIDEPFVFKISSESPKLKYIESDNQVAFTDRDGNLRLMRMKQLYEESTQEESLIRVVCEPSYLELYDHFIEDKRFTDKTAQDALNGALQGSRYIGEVTVELGLATDNFYWIDGIGAVFKILETWGGALKDTITLDEENEIIERKLWIVQRLGTDNGLIVEPDFNAESIERKTLSYVKTALWGQGSSLEITDEDDDHTGGYTRYITFEDIEWKVSAGDPVDKPKGQKWVGDPQALSEHGDLHNGIRKHRFGHFSNQDYETPEELLWATWQELQERKLKEIMHEASIIAGDKIVSLGDTVTILDRNYNKPIELQSQITGLEYDPMYPDEEVSIIIGKYIDMNDDQLQKDIDDLKDAIYKPRPTAPITDGSFPDIKPGIPVSIDAVGGIGVIQLYWDYDSKVYVSHYEVYGSQIADFVPDTQHLLYRGRVSAFAHIVDTDEKWYYYLRAVNTRGTPSGFSQRVEASSVRVISDDILFGSIIADHLSNNLDIADKLAQNTIDAINRGPMVEIEYTQEQITATENRLLDQLNNEIGDVNTSISDLLTRTQGIEGTVTNITQNVDEIKGELSTTITQLSNIDGVVSAQGTTLQQHAGLINAKAEKSEVYTRTQTDGLLGDKVDFNIYSNKMTNLDLTIDGLNTTVSNTNATVIDLTGEVVNAQSQIADLNIRAGGIELGVSDIRTDLTSTQSQMAAINVKADGIISTVENIQIGGRNLHPNSGSPYYDISRYAYNPKIVTIDGKECVAWTGTNNILATTSIGGPLKDGDVFTFSFYAKATKQLNFRQGIYLNASNRGYLNGQVITTSWKRYWFSGTFSGDIAIQLHMYPLIANGDGTYETIYLADWQLEKGNKATDWTPAPEDTDARMTKSESKITQLSDEVDIKVDKNGVVASINLSSEGVRINGNRHHITGQTLIDNAVIGTAAIANLSVTNAKIATLAIGTAQIQDAAITNAKIHSLNADKLNAGAIRGIDIYGAKFRSSAGTDYMEIVGGEIDLMLNNGRYMNLSPTGLYGYNAGGSVRFRADSLLVTSAALGTSNSNVYLAPDSTNEARIVDVASIPSDGAADSYRYRPLRALGYRFGPDANGYIGTDREVRITSSGFTQVDGSVVYRNLRAGKVFADEYEVNSGDVLYLRSDDRVRIMRTGSSAAYANLQVNNIQARSIRFNGELTTSHFYIGTPGETRFTSNSLGDETIIYRDTRMNKAFTNQVEVNTGDVLYLRSDDRVRVMGNGSSGSYSDIEASTFYGTSFVNNRASFIYFGSDSGIRVTSRGTTSIDPLVYRPVYASDFAVRSSRKSKENVRDITVKGLDIIKDLNIVNFDYIQGDKNNIGVIAEDSNEISDGEFVSLSDTIFYNSLAIQEIDTKLIKVDDAVGVHDLKIQFLEQRLEQEIKQRKELENRVQQLEGVA